jgi:hypothetical protein
MTRIDLWPEQPTLQADQIETGFVLEDASTERQRFWYRFSSGLQPALTDSCDPYVLPAVFLAMQRKADLVVHGQVSPSLLKNLAEFQTTWGSWRPGVYTPVEIIADDERECQLKPERGVLASFSGGLDSVFTVWRHQKGLAGRQNQKIQSALMLHGFDIPLNQPDVFARAAHKARLLLDSLGIELLTLVTNLKKSELTFNDAHPALLASCMMLFQQNYATGLIASSNTYHYMNIPWGSNPVIDWLLSSDSFATIHDGAAFSRLSKAKALGTWPEVAQYLRVCVRGPARDKNCCRCEKCVRTILIFRALGLGLPACFDRDVTNRQIVGLNMYHPRRFQFYKEILDTASQNKVSASWVIVLKLAYALNKFIYKLYTLRLLLRSSRSA